MIVVDIGCQPQENEESIEKLCKAYHPAILYGFDPHPDLVPGIERYEFTRDRRGRRSHAQRMGHQEPTLVVRSRLAAWTHDGFISYREAGIASRVVPPEESAAVVPCFDLVAWMKTLPLPEEEVVVKMDAEGAEYPLTWAIHEAGLDFLIKEMLVEYHPGLQDGGFFREGKAPLRCPVDDWDANW